jgi:hypothetical protein
MGSGAYAVVIDPPAGLAANTPFTRVVPLPPAGNTGSVRFQPVFVSVAVAGPTLPITILATLIRAGGSQTLGPFPINAPGRQGICQAGAGDLAVEIGFTPANVTTITPPTAVTALVEYGTP